MVIGETRQKGATAAVHDVGAPVVEDWPDGIDPAIESAYVDPRARDLDVAQQETHRSTSALSAPSTPAALTGARAMGSATGNEPASQSTHHVVPSPRTT